MVFCPSGCVEINRTREFHSLKGAEREKRHTKSGWSRTNEITHDWSRDKLQLRLQCFPPLRPLPVWLVRKSNKTLIFDWLIWTNQGRCHLLWGEIGEGLQRFLVVFFGMLRMISPAKFPEFSTLKTYSTHNIIRFHQTMKSGNANLKEFLK